MAVIENGMIIAKVPVYWQEFVKGIVIIVAIISSIADHIIKVIPERGKVA